MEILLRSNNNLNYEWRNATWRNGNYYTIDEAGYENSIRETNILAVRNDERIGKVECAYCHELIPSDNESILRHYEEVEAKRDCLKCERMEIGHRDTKNIAFKPNANGTYEITEVFVAELLCGDGYWSGYNINSDRAKRDCQYMQCRRMGVRQINDIFVKCPEPFVRQITVDVLNSKKYQYEGYYNGYFYYDMKSRNTLKACVNELGIVDHFIMTHRGWEWTVYYSDKYNRLFYSDCGRYRDDLANQTSESKVNSTIKKISELFKEENGNDEK